MNQAEAMQMIRADGIDDGYRRGVADAIDAIRIGRDDWSGGEDIGKLINSILAVAEDRIKDLLKTGGCACTSIDRSHCREPDCSAFAPAGGKTPHA